jgi:hypothetical protein
VAIVPPAPFRWRLPVRDVVRATAGVRWRGKPDEIFSVPKLDEIFTVPQP